MLLIWFIYLLPPVWVCKPFSKKDLETLKNFDFLNLHQEVNWPQWLYNYGMRIRTQILEQDMFEVNLIVFDLIRI